jgi:hypothetical protein
MGAQIHPSASRISGFTCPPFDSLGQTSLGTRVRAKITYAFRHRVALTVALLLLPIGQCEVLARQAAYYGQYAPTQQSGYMQVQTYGQPSYVPEPPRSYSQQPYPISSQIYPQPNYAQAQPTAQPLNARRLEQLVAPIALYPDTLVAEIVTASTYPLQLVDADRWRQAQGSGYSDQIAAGANSQSWDPSVKALTAFPQVLMEMDQNLQWTTELGNAYYNQPQEIFAAVQVMRQRAEAAGNLQSTPQQAVSYSQGNILLAPPTPQTVYVPAYNPWTVYGEPVTPYPGFSLLSALGSFLGSSSSSFGSSPLNFGLGIAMTAFSRMGWGWLGWGLNWLAHTVLFNQSDYYSQSTTVADWGLPYGGSRGFSQGRGPASQAGFYRASAGYGLSGGRYNGTPAQGFMRTPYRYPYGGNRPAEYGRGYQTPQAGGYGRSGQEGYNRVPLMTNRPQQYGSSSYGSGLYNRPGQNYDNRRAPSYNNSMQAYRGSAAGVQRSDFGRQSSNAGMSRGFGQSSSKPARSGGFHLFGGGGHAPKSYSGGKSFGGGKNFGGGKSFGGHSGGGGHGGHGGGEHH